jgi:hypothetical protein
MDSLVIKVLTLSNQPWIDHLSFFYLVVNQLQQLCKTKLQAKNGELPLMLTPRIPNPYMFHWQKLRLWVFHLI